MPPELSEIGAKIMEVLSEAALQPEFIVERTGHDTAAVMSELTMLELDGLVSRDAGGYSVKP